MFSGRCECGEIEFRVTGEVHDFSHCHCSQCRRLHGAAFVSFAGVSRGDFDMVRGEESLSKYASSATHKRVFCKHCGSSLFTELESEPDALYLAMGTLDGDPNCPPGYHIYVGSKAPWHTIEDELPQFETEPDEDWYTS